MISCTTCGDLRPDPHRPPQTPTDPTMSRRYRVLSKLGAGAFSTAGPRHSTSHVECLDFEVWLCADEKDPGTGLVAMKAGSRRLQLRTWHCHRRFASPRRVWPSRWAKCMRVSRVDSTHILRFCASALLVLVCQAQDEVMLLERPKMR